MELYERTVSRQLEWNAAEYFDDVMFQYTELDYTRTWSEFDYEADMVAKGLLALGLEKGSHVGTWTANIPAFFLTFFGTLKLGAVFVPFNTGYKAAELEYQLRQSDTHCLFLMDGVMGREFVETLQALIPELETCTPGKLQSAAFPALRALVYAGRQECPRGMLSWNEFLAAGAEISSERLTEAKHCVNGQDTAAIMYTSGTTGMSKGVMLTHDEFLLVGGTFKGVIGNFQDDRICIMTPGFHMMALICLMVSVLTAIPLYPAISLHPNNLINIFATHQCTAAAGVLILFQRMFEHPDFEKRMTHNTNIIVVTGEATPLEFLRAVQKNMHAKKVIYSLVQTESSCCGPVATLDEMEQLGRLTVGKVQGNGVECKVVDPKTGEIVPPGTVGELCLRGPSVMQGYYNQPEATARVIDAEGWLHFGDLVTCDELGYYTFVERMKDIIIRGGENISATEVEQALAAHPDVQAAQVVGIPDKAFGEAVCAFVILNPEACATAAELQEFCKARLAKFKVPQHIRFVETYPRNATGKVMKYLLAEQF